MIKYEDIVKRISFIEKRKIKKYLKKCLTIKEMTVIIIAVCRTVRYKFRNRTPKLASNY